MHHSDRGSQYCSKAYVDVLRNNNIAISMTKNGDPYENAMAERVNGILKTELLEAKYEDPQQASAAIEKAIDLYNNKRPHLSIEMLTPNKAHLQKGELKMMWKKKDWVT